MGGGLVRCDSGRRIWRQAPATVATGLLILASLAQAGPSAAGTGSGSTAAAPAPGSPSCVGWSGMPRGQRSGDAHFIRMMIPHHDGAIAMAELALKRSVRAEIRALAERIRIGQSRENAQMRRWYRQWYGTDVPSRSGPGMGMGMGWGMPGFSTSLDALRDAPEFDRTFLEQMIAHHRMGVMMAAHARWGTIHRVLRELEEAMVRVQSQEIEQMARWYRQWYGAGAR